MNERRAVTREVAKGYQKSSKKQRGKILDEFTALMGYNRSYASHILSNWGRKVFRDVESKQWLSFLVRQVEKGRDRQRHN